MVHPVRDQWWFLEAARGALPPGASYSVDGPDPDAEHTLHMLALALLPDNRSLPASYFGRPTGAPPARFVLSWGCEAGEPELRLVARVHRGCVFERPPPAAPAPAGEAPEP